MNTHPLTAFTCQLDSGSATGNTPLCERPADWTVIYRNGSTGPFAAHACNRHLAATRGRVHPGLITIQPVDTRTRWLIHVRGLGTGTVRFDQLHVAEQAAAFLREGGIPAEVTPT